MAGVQRDGASVLRQLVVLGATGSIGRQALEVAAELGFPVACLAARRASSDLDALAAQWPGARVVTVEADGADGVVEAAATADAIVVNGIVGAAGLRPSLAALRAGNRLALANKESLVAGGELVMTAARSGGGELIPVDSEHNALWQCLEGESRTAVRRLVLTASGGPFRGRAGDELEAVTAPEALSHPTWSMGPRITVDSATLMNKALEVIEAHHLFDMPYDAIDVVVHPQSVVHSLVEFVDGSLKAELGEPDMRVPIRYALTYPERRPASGSAFAVAGLQLTFEPPDRATFPCLDLGYAAGRAGGTAPAVLNAADEVAVGAFLAGRIRFVDIAAVVAATLDSVEVVPADSVSAVLAADESARRRAGAVVTERAGS